MIFVDNVKQVIDYAMSRIELVPDGYCIVIRAEDIDEAMHYLFGELNLNAEFINIDNESDYLAIAIFSDYTIGIEPIMQRGKYLPFACNHMLLDEDVPSKFQTAQEDTVNIEIFSYKDDRFELDSYDEATHVSRDKDGKVCGFTKSWTANEGRLTSYNSYTYYSNNQDELKDIAEKFGIKL